MNVPQLVDEDFEDASSLWRHARSAYQLSEEDDKNKKELLKEALDHIKRSVNEYGDDNNARRWYGTVLQASSSYEGYKQQIKD